MRRGVSPREPEKFGRKSSGGMVGAAIVTDTFVPNVLVDDWLIVRLRGRLTNAVRELGVAGLVAMLDAAWVAQGTVERNADAYLRCPSEGRTESGVIGTESVDGRRMDIGKRTAGLSAAGRGIVDGALSDSDMRSER